MIIRIDRCVNRVCKISWFVILRNYFDTFQFLMKLVFILEMLFQVGVFVQLGKDLESIKISKLI